MFLAKRNYGRLRTANDLTGSLLTYILYHLSRDRLRGRKRGKGMKWRGVLEEFFLRVFFSLSFSLMRDPCGGNYGFFRSQMVKGTGNSWNGGPRMLVVLLRFRFA